MSSWFGSWESVDNFITAHRQTDKTLYGLYVWMFQRLIVSEFCSSGLKNESENDDNVTLHADRVQNELNKRKFQLL